MYALAFKNITSGDITFYHFNSQLPNNIFILLVVYLYFTAFYR